MLFALVLGTLLPIATPLRSEDIAVPINAPRSEVGRWLGPARSPVLGIHAAVLPTGKVLLYSYPDMGDDFQVPPPTNRSAAYVWSPRDRSFKDVTWDYNVFCSGHSYLADGTLYVTGGWDASRCSVGGIPETFLFDPFLEAWFDAPAMKRARYYPSNLTLHDGRVVIMAGLNQNCSSVSPVEIYTPGAGTRIVPHSGRHLELYPQLHLLPDGRVAMVGPEPMTATFDPATGTWQNIARTRLGLLRDHGNSAQIPGQPNRLMICGGYIGAEQTATATCERIGFGGKQPPQWRYLSSMHHPRGHLNMVILPDKSILVIGGGTEGPYRAAVRNAELYDPETDSWTLLPPQRYARMYHSTAVLLPDGRVLSAGHDQHRKDIDLGRPENGDRYEIYKPAYLFRGERPALGRAPLEIAYGGSFELSPPRAAEIESVVLISLSAVTHSTNTTQRLVDLDFNLTPGGTLLVRSPQKGELAPPGYYMLFILNGDDVPSRSKILRLDTELSSEQDGSL